MLVPWAEKKLLSHKSETTRTALRKLWEDSLIKNDNKSNNGSTASLPLKRHPTSSVQLCLMTFSLALSDSADPCQKHINMPLPIS